jgi:hypothetical protein
VDNLSCWPGTIYKWYKIIQWNTHTHTTKTTAFTEKRIWPEQCCQWASNEGSSPATSWRIYWTLHSSQWLRQVNDRATWWAYWLFEMCTSRRQLGQRRRELKANTNMNLYARQTRVYLGLREP